MSWLVVVCLVAVVLLIIAAPFYIYDQFDAEYPIARIEFKKLDHQRYLAELRTTDPCNKREFLIQGDQWQLDASFIKWQGPAVLLGFKSRYRLDRLSGRYRSLEDQNTRPTSAHGLSPEVWFDIFAHQELDGESSFLVDTVFGSSVYLDINTSSIYTIYRTEDALIAKLADRPKAVVEKGLTTIYITEACANNFGVFESLARTFNRVAIKLF